jgi:hypothetical protein
MAAVAARLGAAVKVQQAANTLFFNEEPCGAVNVTGSFAGNLVLAVSVRPVGGNRSVSVSPGRCREDATTQRPLLAQFSVDPGALDDDTAATNAVLRAALHAAAFRVSLVGRFRHPDGMGQTYYEFDKAAFPTGPIAGMAVSAVVSPGAGGSNATAAIAVDSAAAAGTGLRLASPNAVAAARAYLGCAVLAAAELEDSGYGRRLLFLEKRVFMTELMTDAPIGAAAVFYLSDMALAVLRDSGWYAADAAAADAAMTWGRGAGCDFAASACGFGGWPANYLCQASAALPAAAAEQCGFDMLFTGRCAVERRTAPIPSVYRVFRDTLLVAGTDAAADYCPYVARAPTGGACSTASAAENLHQGRFGAASQCFVASTRRAAMADRNGGAACFGTLCHAGVLHAAVGGQYVACAPGRSFVFAAPRSAAAAPPNGSAAVRVMSVDTAGTLACGSALDIALRCRAGNGGATVLYLPQLTAVAPSTATLNGGAAITLHGANLIDCRHVRVGGVFAAVVYHFQTQTLRGRVPPMTARAGGYATDGTGAADVELWCNVSALCPGGCAVGRLGGAMHFSRRLPCNASADEYACGAQPECTWLNATCDAKQTAAPTTAAPVTHSPSAGFDAGCTVTVPVRCPSTATCARTASLCVACSPSQVQCWDSRCVGSVADCDCPPAAPARCPDGRCAVLASRCGDACNSTGAEPWMCATHECASDAAGCACRHPLLHYRCAAPPNACAADLSACDEACPVATPRRCWDATCRAAVTECPCPVAAPVRCADGSCAASRDGCGCPAAFPQRCRGARSRCIAATGSCATWVAACPLPSIHVRCPDGTCASAEATCSCAESSTLRPSVQILAPAASHFSTAAETRVVAAARWAPCGFDRSAEVAFVWKVQPVDGASAVVVTAAGSPVVMLSPLALQHNTTYDFGVTATAPNRRAAATSVRVVGAALKPRVAIIGGDREVPAASTITLTVAVGTPGTDRRFAWHCCTQSPLLPDACGGNCPLLFERVSDVSLPTVHLSSSSPLPLGSYLFTVTVIDTNGGSREMVNATTRVAVVSAGRECFLYVESAAAVMVVADIVVRVVHVPAVGAAAAPAGSFILRWLLNGTVVGGGSSSDKLRIAQGRIPPGATTVVSATVSTVGAASSSCSLRVKPSSARQNGWCQVTNSQPYDADFNTNVGTSAVSDLTVRAFGWDETSGPASAAPRLTYRFGYYDLQQRRVLLSAEPSQSPLLTARAPLLQGTPSLARVRFFVEAMAAGDAAALLSATCAVTLKAAAGRSTASRLASLRAQATVAARTGSDAAAPLLQIAQRIVAMLHDTDVAEADRSAAASDVLRHIDAVTAVSAQRRAAATTSLMSPTRRHLVITSLAAALPLLPPSSAAVAHVEAAARVVAVLRRAIPPLGATAPLGVVESHDAAPLLRCVAWVASADTVLRAIVGDVAMLLAVAQPRDGRTGVLAAVPMTTGDASALAIFYHRDVVRDSATRMSITIASVATIDIAMPPSASRDAMRSGDHDLAVGGAVYAASSPLRTTVGLAANATSDAVIAGPQVWFRARHVDSQGGLASGATQPIEVAMTFAGRAVVDAMATQQLECARLDDGGAQWTPLGAPVVADGGRRLVCRAACDACTVVLVFRAAVPPPAPSTAVPPQLAAPQSPLERIAPMAWAAIVLGALVLIVAAAMGAVLLRRHVRRPVEAQQRQEAAQLVSLGELLTHDRELQRAIDLAKVRQKYKDDL